MASQSMPRLNSLVEMLTPVISAAVHHQLAFVTSQQIRQTESCVLKVAQLVIHAAILSQLDGSVARLSVDSVIHLVERNAEPSVTIPETVSE